MERQSVLLVDDEVSFRDRLGRALTDRGYEVTTAGTVREALAVAEQDSPEFALVDLRLPDGSGLDAVRALLGIDAHTHVVVLTGYGSIATAIEAVRLGARDYLTKPVDADQVVAAFQKSGPSVEGAPEVTTPSLARVEWEHIQRVLADCGGNVSQAARVLGIHRRSLQRKLGKYPVRR
jgi:two-component system, response regulator RegA